MMKKNRFVELDYLRGIAVIIMILVNCPGNSKQTLPFFEHAKWNGFTIADFAFPCFVYCLGFSVALSFKRFQYCLSIRVIVKILKRTFFLLCLGLLLNYMNGFIGRLFDTESLFSGKEKVRFAFDYYQKIRWGGVLQRLGICYLFVGFLTCLLTEKGRIWAIIFILLGYTLFLLLGNGYDQTENNLVGVIDRLIIPQDHIFTYITTEGNKLQFEPLGIVSTIPSIAQALLGAMCGSFYIKDSRLFLGKMSSLGTVLLFSGYLSTYLIPCNKTLWSPSFVLITSGIFMLLLALLGTDCNIVTKWKKRHRYIMRLGTSSGIIYFSTTVLYMILEKVRISSENGTYTILEKTYDIVDGQIKSPIVTSYLICFLFLLFSIVYAYANNQHKRGQP